MTLQQLDGEDWGSAGGASHLVTTIHRLRRKPIGEFTVEDLRIMLGQRVSVQYLLPRALDLLAAAPLAEGDFYPGDLFQAVARVPEDAWRDAPQLAARVGKVARAVVEALEQSWTDRREEARRVYGADLTVTDVSDGLEREIWTTAKRLLSDHGEVGF